MVSPERFEKVLSYEKKFNVTIHRNENFGQRADRGVAANALLADIEAAKAESFVEDIILPEGAWKLPLGAFAESCGPI